MTQRLPLLLLLLACVGACGDGGKLADAKPPPAGGLRIVDEGSPRPYFHDFGEIEWGKLAEHTFLLQNTTSAPIVLLDLQGQCACTQLAQVRAIAPDGSVSEGDARADDGMVVVPPNGRAELVVRVDSGKTTANRNKLEVMRLTTDSPETPFITFEVRLFPRQLFQLTPSTLDLEDVPQSSGKSGVVRIITGVKDSPARIVGIREQGQHVRASLERTVALDEDLWVLEVQVPALLPLGLVRDQVVLSTTDAEGQGEAGTQTVPVWARVVPDVLLYPPQINLGALTQTDSHEVAAKLAALAPGMRVRILAGRIEGGSAERLSVEYEPVAPDEQGRSGEWRLRVRAQPGLPVGRVDATLVLELDDSQYPEVRGHLAGYVR